MQSHHQHLPGGKTDAHSGLGFACAATSACTAASEDCAMRTWSAAVGPVTKV